MIENKRHNVIRELWRTVRFIVDHPLNKQRKGRALGRFLAWQIGSRIVPGRVVYEWLPGAKFIVGRGETGLTQNIYCGLHEYSEMAYVLHVAGPEDFFVDIGANVGSYTLLACAVKGARGCCFEPVPSTYERLMDNIRLNNLVGQVSAVNAGLAGAPGELLFTTRENCTNHVVSGGEECGHALRVKVLALDDALTGMQPTFLKIDVEGFEQTVVAGAKGVLSSDAVHSVIMELNGSGERYGYKDADLIEKMRGYGFARYAYEPLTRTLLKQEAQNMQTGNALFIRNEAVVRERIARVSPLVINGITL